MDAVTYPDDRVQTLLSRDFVTFKPDINTETDLAKRFNVYWTPGLVWADPGGQVQHSNYGYFPTEEFLAENHVALGRAEASKGNWAGARRHFDTIIEELPRTHAAPAAMYWAGVANYKTSHSADQLLEYWKRLLKEHHGSSWAMKVSFLQQKK